MSADLTVALVAGALGVGGTLAGAVATSLLSASTEKRRVRAEDERRWLQERRSAYSSYLGLVQHMLREIDSIGVFLPSDGGQALKADEVVMQNQLYAYFTMWDDQLQPALGEVQLLASTRVAELADRVSGALMEITSPIELRQPFSEYYPAWFQARDLASVLLDAMRAELGLSEPINTAARRADDWPWLSDRPAAESYLQSHARADNIEPGDD